MYSNLLETLMPWNEFRCDRPIDSAIIRMGIGIRWMLKASTYHHEWIIVSNVGKKKGGRGSSTHQVGGFRDWLIGLPGSSFVIIAPCQDQKAAMHLVTSSRPAAAVSSHSQIGESNFGLLFDAHNARTEIFA
jgi:hypothetical protein